MTLGVRHGRSGGRWALVPALLLLVAACGGGSSDPTREDGNGGDGAAFDEDACSQEALDEAAADGPVEVTFWHAMTDVPRDVLERMVREFNQSQDRVEVAVVGNNDYQDQQEKYRAGMQTGDLPDLVQHQEVFLQQMIDTQTALPVEACIEAEDFDTSDYLPRTVNYYAVEDVQWAMPFNVNTPVLLYNRTAFEDAGLDPDDPPGTLDELYDTAEALQESGAVEQAGMGLKREGWEMEQFRALQGLPLVDSGNGRDGRATEVVFDDEAGLEILAALDRMVEDGLAVTNPAEGPNSFDNLTGVGSGSFGMTFGSSGVLGVVEQLLQNQYPDVEPGVAPLPGRTEDGGALLGGGSLYISTDDPATQAATWEVIKYLTSPEVQAEWAAETGFVPVRESSVDVPVLQDQWSDSPHFRVAYDQLVEGAENEATAGPVLGPYQGYREIMQEVLRELFEGDLTPEEAVEAAADRTDERIQTYNDRVEID